MLARIRSSLLQGIDALPCEVEVDYDPTAIDRFPLIVGLPDAAVKESLERVRAALTNTGYYPPAGRLLVNLAPADLKKEGPVYDLPIAVGMLAVNGVIKDRPEGGLDYRHAVLAGELALDGRVRPIKGALALASMAKATGATAAIVPAENAAEASIVGGIDVYGVSTVAELVGLLTGQLEVEPHAPPDVGGILRQAEAPIDFAEVRGQESVKRAITIAAAGQHNILRLWPSGGYGGRRERGSPRPPVGHNLLRLWPSGGYGGRRERGSRRSPGGHDLRGPGGGDGGGGVMAIGRFPPRRTSPFPAAQRGDTHGVAVRSHHHAAAVVGGGHRHPHLRQD